MGGAGRLLLNVPNISYQPESYLDRVNMIHELTLLLACLILLNMLLIIISILRFFMFGSAVKKSCLYLGRVRHNRLKGGATHSINYPIFLAYIDVDEISKLGWQFWPIFAKGSKYFAYCSFDSSHHLTSWQSKKSFRDKIIEFIQSKKKNELNVESVCLLTHLTYFGYCFNPISIYYLFKRKLSEDANQQNGDKILPYIESPIDTIIAEVNNTPWVEQYPYVLTNDGDGEFRVNGDGSVDAKCAKNFHVSPFLGLDYDYR